MDTTYFILPIAALLIAALAVIAKRHERATKQSACQKAHHHSLAGK